MKMPPVAIEGLGLGAPLYGSGAPVDGTNEVQTLTVNGSPTGGTYRLAFEGYTTAAIAFDAAAAAVQTALRALPSIGTAGVGVAGSAGGPYTITFAGNLAKLAVPLITVPYNNLTGGTAPANPPTVAETTPGVTATGRGIAVGGKYVDTDDGTEYRNTGTPLEPTWATTDAIDTGELAPGVLAATAPGRALMADDYFNVATADAKFADDALDEAFLTAKIAADAFTEAAVDSAFAAGAIDADILKPATLDGANAKVVANVNVIGGQLLVHTVLVPSGANGDVDVVLTHKTRVVDYVATMKGAGTAGSALTVKNGANAIGVTHDVSAAADQDVVRATKIDDARHEVAASGTLRVTKASTGGDFPGAEVTVYGYRVA